MEWKKDTGLHILIFHFVIVEIFNTVNVANDLGKYPCFLSTNVNRETTKMIGSSTSIYKSLQSQMFSNSEEK